MRKSDKKIENQLRIVLTAVCETALKDIVGFQWLTHAVNYAYFTQTLKIICVFDTKTNLDNYLQSTVNTKLAVLIHSELTGINIKIKNISNHIFYDTEEGCKKQNDNNWAKRVR